MRPGRHDRIAALFERAVELQPSERLSYLKAECGDDSEMVDVVLRLIEMDPGSPTSVPETSILDDDAAASEMPLLRRFEPLERLGSGGMGSVFLARTRSATATVPAGSQVAVKVVHPHLLESDGFFKRFLNEAHIGQQVCHPNVVRILDVDRESTGTREVHFMVMEYVAGQSLDILLREVKTLPEDLCRLVGAEVARGLAALHDHGVVHRDIKPANILTTAENNIKIADLGIARSANEFLRLSRTGQFVGSLAYAAPEQIRGDEIDGRADLYALGVSLYELATGTVPFAVDNPAAAIHAHLHQDPRAPTRLNPQISPFFERIILTLLEKSPDARFQTATEVVETLQAGEDSAWWRLRTGAPRVTTRRATQSLQVRRETDLYGRAHLLASMVRAFNRVSEGKGQALLLEGEPGAGKTRLLDEFIRRLDSENRSFELVLGTFPPGEDSAGAEILLSAFRDFLGAGKDLEARLRGLLPDSPALVPRLASCLRGEVSGEDFLTDSVLHTVFVRLSRAVAVQNPLLIVMDNLHGARPDAIQLIANLVSSIAGNRILVLGTLLPGTPYSQLSDLERLPHVERHEVGRLGPKDLIALLGEALSSRQLAHDVCAVIAEKTDGNPFFVFELLEALRHQGGLVADGQGSWRVTKDLERLSFPSTVRDLVEMRLAQLAEPDRELLEVAASQGFSFDAAVLASVARVDRLGVLKRLAYISRKLRLIHSEGRRFVFDQNQLQIALYESLPQMLREEYHTMNATTLEELHRGDEKDPSEVPGEAAALICDQYLRGSKPLDGLRYFPAAVRFLKVQGRRYQIISLAERLVRSDGQIQNADLYEVLLSLADSMLLAGRVKESEACLHRAREVSRELSAERVERLFKLECELLLTTGLFQEAEGVARDYLRFAKESDDALLEAQALNLLGRAISRTSAADALPIFRQVVERARFVGATEIEAAAEEGMGRVLSDLHRIDESKTHRQQALELYRRLGDRSGEAVSSVNAAMVQHSQSNYAAARDSLEAGAAIFRELANRKSEAFCIENKGKAELGLANYDAALADFEGAARLYEELTNRAKLCLVRRLTGEVFILLGDWCSADQHLQRALADAGKNERALAEIAMSRGYLAEQTGALDEAIAAYESTVEVLNGTVAGLESNCYLYRAKASRGDSVPTSVWGDWDSERVPPYLRVLKVLVEAGAGHELGDAEETFQRHQEGFTGRTRMEYAYLLWRLTGRGHHLRTAIEALDSGAHGVPAKYRPTYLQQPPLHKAIHEARSHLDL